MKFRCNPAVWHVSFAHLTSFFSTCLLLHWPPQKATGFLTQVHSFFFFFKGEKKKREREPFRGHYIHLWPGVQLVWTHHPLLGSGEHTQEAQHTVCPRFQTEWKKENIIPLFRLFFINLRLTVINWQLLNFQNLVIMIINLWLHNFP